MSDPASPSKYGGILSHMSDANALLELLSSLNAPQSASANLTSLNSKTIGGASGLCRLLDVEPDRGIDGCSVAARIRLMGSNVLPSAPRKNWWQLFFDTFDDETVQILAVAAVVSLAVGIYDDPATGYVEGCAILVAILVVSVVTACNDYQKESQFRMLSVASEASVMAGAVRDGAAVEVSVEELVVGDVVTVEAGARIPCDGVLLSCDGLEVDESALTGEPEDVAKDLEMDPFVLSGCVAAAGMGTLVVTAVGARSQWGKIKSKLDKEQEQTPLQEKLDAMANAIGNVGIAAAVATFIAMMGIKIFVNPDHLQHIGVFNHALDAFIIGVTIVVVAVPEGLPLAVTIALAFSTKKMLADQNLIRHLHACETMGNATNICSDKTGTLTENRMTVLRATFATLSHDGTPDRSVASAPTPNLAARARETILRCIACCSTARIAQCDHSENIHDNKIIGNKTEGAMLLVAAGSWGSNDDYEARRERCSFGKAGGSRLFPFSSRRKRMTVLVAEGEGKKKSWTLYLKGAAEVVVDDCTSYLKPDGSTAKMTPAKREEFHKIIQSYASQALRCVALCHRDEVQNALNKDLQKATAADVESLEQNLCLDAIVGIADPLRSDVVGAVATCQEAGIIVRMVTGDNLETAKAIAKEAGILTEDGICMVGEDFRKLTPAKLDNILPKLQVLARSSPEDKHLLVQRLNGGLIPANQKEWEELHPGRNFKNSKDLLLPGYKEEWLASHKVGEVVGVTGDGTNDGPALKAADVGMSMGISGTDVAKNASDIIILDDNFSSIVKAVLWGRSVYDNIRRFLQFQLTVNVVALTITFLSALVGYKPPLNAVMMLWVNLIMDTMGALALGTEPPTDDLLYRRPYKRDSTLISRPMWRNILCQSLYQLGLLIFLLIKGPEIFECVDGSVEHFTIIFNAFVFCQIFNEFNAREIGDVFDPFRNLITSPMFTAVIFFTVLAQYVIVEYGGDFTQTEELSTEEWVATIILGAGSIPVGFFMRLIPVSEDPECFAGVPHAKQGTCGRQSFVDKLKHMVVPVACAAVLFYYADDGVPGFD